MKNIAPVLGFGIGAVTLIILLKQGSKASGSDSYFTYQMRFIGMMELESNVYIPRVEAKLTNVSGEILNYKGGFAYSGTGVDGEQPLPASDIWKSEMVPGETYTRTLASTQTGPFLTPPGQWEFWFVTSLNTRSPSVTGSLI